MNRIIQLTLQIGLLATSITAILMALRIFGGTIVDDNWFWGGAVAAFLGPVSFALAIYLYEHRIAEPHGVTKEAVE